MDNLEQVISNSIADLPGSEASDGSDTPDVPDTTSETADTPTDTTVGRPQASTDDVPGPETDTPKPPVADPPDELLTNEFRGNKHNRIPYNRVRSIVDNAVKKEAEKHAAKLQEYEQQHSAIQNERQALRVAEENPEQFLAALAQADPRYAKLLAREAQQTAKREAVSEKPQPDIQLEDGRTMYSSEQQERLAEWVAQQQVAEVEQRYAERFGPIEQEYKATQAIHAAIPKVRNQIATAEKWPGFNDHKPAIIEALKKDRNLTLESAYIAVVLPKLQVGNDEMRKRVLAEMNQKPRAASSPVASTASPEPTGPRSLEDVIRDSIAHLKRA